MKKYIAIIIILMIGVTGCSDANSINKAMIKDITDIKTDEVFLAEATTVAWDYMYSFAPYTSKADIQNTLGFEADVNETVNEGMTHIIFVKDEKLVCELIGYPHNINISITMYNSKLSKENAEFYVTKKNGITFLREKATELSEDALWKKIENREWTTLEKGSLGFGIYFYEKNGKKTALTMIYGSGLPVIHTHESQVKMNKNEMHFDFPNGRIIEKNNNQDQIVGIGLHFKNEKLYFGSDELKEIFPYNEDYNHYDAYVSR